MATLDAVLELLQKLSGDVKSLHRDVRKVRQAIDDPTGEKAEIRSKNNGFKKPMDVDDALRGFLGIAPDAKISRSEVTKAIDAYAVANNLKNGKVISMDDKLKALLNPAEGSEVSYLKLQHYLAPHYIKAPAPEPASDAAPAAPKKAPRPKVKSSA